MPSLKQILRKPKEALKVVFPVHYIANDPRGAYEDAYSAIVPEMPQIPDAIAPPTINTARQRRDEFDRLRRRRGVLANIFAGTGSGIGSGTAGLSSTLG